MKPSKGRTVLFVGSVQSNGTNEHPAVITRTFSDVDPALTGYTHVNLTVFPDGGTPTCKSSVLMFEDQAAADEYLAGQGFPKPDVCFWPARV